jgi:membrane protein implicated in regulation of membrane protease activity
MASRPRGDLPFGPPAHSALNLRLALAIFGLAAGIGGAVISFLTGFPLPGIIFVALACLAIVNIAVVQRRRIQRRRAEGGRRHSMFE